MRLSLVPGFENFFVDSESVLLLATKSFLLAANSWAVRLVREGTGDRTGDVAMMLLDKQDVQHLDRTHFEGVFRAWELSCRYRQLAVEVAGEEVSRQTAQPAHRILTRPAPASGEGWQAFRASDPNRPSQGDPRWS